MRILSLKIRNFRVLKAFSYEFGEQVIGIVGPNGAGKSSIIEALAWALWGNPVARTGKDEIRSVFAGPDEACEVELGLAMRDESYTIRRSISGRGQTSADMHCGQAMVATGVRETQEAIGKLIGLDSRGFLSSVLARQQELNALSDLTPSARKEKLATMLGVDRLDRAIGRLKEDNRVVQGKIEQLGAIVARREQQETEREQLRKRLAEAEKQVLAAKEKLAGRQERLKRAGEELAVWQQKKGEADKLGIELKWRRDQAGEVSQTIGRLTEKLARLTEASDRLPKLEAELAGAAAVSSELKRLEQAQSELKLVQGLKAQIGGREREIEAAEVEIGKLTAERGELERLLKSLPENLAERVSKLRDEREKARDRFGTKRASVRQLEQDLAKIERQLEQIDQWGPDSVCDRCHRKLGDDLVEVRGHFEREKGDVAGRLRPAKQELQEVTTVGTNLASQVAELEGKLEKSRDLASRLEVVSGSLKQQTLGRDRAERERQQLAGQLAPMGQVVFDPQAYEKVQKEKERLDGLRREYDRLSGEVKERQSVTEDLAKAHKQQQTLQKDIESYTASLSGLGYSEQAFMKAKAAFEAEQTGADAAKDEYQSRVQTTALLSRDIESLDKQIEEARRLGESLEGLRTDRFYGEKLVNLFGDFRQFLIGRIRPTLAELAGELMAQMTDGRYTTVELDEQYDLQMFDAGEAYGVSRFSGGEKDLANLCLRLAISQALTESAGLPGSFVILDEVFGSQDASRKELILQALANLRGRFPQIILVTHIEDIKDRVEELIEIVPSGQGWSEVRINGQAIQQA